MTSTTPQIEETRYTTKLPHRATCAELMIMAERELAAFIAAVTELYGVEEAWMSAEVWLDELATMNTLPGPASRDWRTVTIAALARLASRLSAAKRSPLPSCALLESELGLRGEVSVGAP